MLPSMVLLSDESLMGKKITIICISYPPEKGAAPSRIYNLATMLRDHGHKVDVITAMPNYPLGRIFPNFRGKLIQKERNNGINITRLWIYPSNSKKPFVRIASMLSYTISLYILGLPTLFTKRPDIVIVSSPPLLSGYAGIIISRISGAKAILNVSDLWPLSALELQAIQKGPFYSFLEWIEKRMYRLADAYIGQSMEILDHIKKLQPKPKKEFLYRNLQETSRYIHKPRPEGRKKIVYAGLLGIAQGLYDVCTNIDFGALGVEFHIYGDGYEKDKIQQLIAAHPERNIYYHESIPAAEVPRMLSDYHATMVPLRTHIHGAVPSKIFMAMSNAIPVFFSGNGEGAKIVREGRIGWVSNPADYRALEDNIKQFVAMTDSEYDIMRVNCKQLRKAQYNKQSQDAAFNDFISSF